MTSLSSDKKPKLIAIVGPTATGKSDFAVALAKKVNGEIISADSRQIYTSMDIGSGKITKKEMDGVPHHLLDVADPRRTFTVMQYKKLAEKAITDIVKRGKVPIICGGTGFYVDTVTSGMVIPAVPPDKTLRKELETYPLGKLFKTLVKLDPTRAETIDRHNPVRLIRAIEIAKALGHVPLLEKNIKYQTYFVGLDLPDEVLKAKIHTRLLARFKIGMLAEIKKLHEQGVSWKKLEAFGLEYRAGAQFLQKKINEQELIEGLETDIWYYAKRQRTWFKRNKNIMWLDPRKKTDSKKILSFAENFLCGR